MCYCNNHLLKLLHEMVFTTGENESWDIYKTKSIIYNSDRIA
jgi:hypothetical protein